MIDPLLVIFAPYAVAATGLLVSPLLFARAFAWRIGLAVTAVGVGGMAIGAGAAFVADIAGSASSLQWWLGPRLLALLVPSAVLAAATPFVLRLGRRANRLTAAADQSVLPPGA